MFLVVVNCNMLTNKNNMLTELTSLSPCKMLLQHLRASVILISAYIIA